jgi:hypothetical protein
VLPPAIAIAAVELYTFDVRLPSDVYRIFVQLSSVELSSDVRPASSPCVRPLSLLTSSSYVLPASLLTSSSYVRPASSSYVRPASLLTSSPYVPADVIVLRLVCVIVDVIILRHACVIHMPSCALLSCRLDVLHPRPAPTSCRLDILRDTVLQSYVLHIMVVHLVVLCLVAYLVAFYRTTVLRLGRFKPYIVLEFCY